MKIEEVIAKGKEFQEPTNFLFAPWSLGLTIFVLITTLIILSAAFYLNKRKKDKDILSIAFSLIAMLLIISVGTAKHYEGTTYDKQKQEWLTEVVEPYILSLPTERFVVKDVDLEQDWDDKVTAYEQSKWITPSYTDKGRYAEVMYIDDADYIKEVTYYFEIKATEEAKPYLEYRKLKKTLGHGVNKGNYNLTLVIPTEYDLD